LNVPRDDRRGQAPDGDRPTANGIAPYTAAFAIVMTNRPGTDVRFDDLSAEEVAAARR
jgi:hypothetical protein